MNKPKPHTSNAVLMAFIIKHFPIVGLKQTRWAQNCWHLMVDEKWHANVLICGTTLTAHPKLADRHYKYMCTCVLIVPQNRATAASPKLTHPDSDMHCMVATNAWIAHRYQFEHANIHLEWYTSIAHMHKQWPHVEHFNTPSWTTL